MTASIFRSRKSIAPGPPYKDGEINSRDEGYRATDGPHTQTGEKDSRDDEKRIGSEVRNPEQYQEREHGAREARLPSKLPREPSSAKEVGIEDRKYSDKSPPSVEQDKDQLERALDSSNISPKRPQALAFIIVGISLSVFLVSLDRTIVTTVRFSIRLHHRDIRR